VLVYSNGKIVAGTAVDAAIVNARAVWQNKLLKSEGDVSPIPNALENVSRSTAAFHALDRKQDLKRHPNFIS
jgi:hypothetical protein